MPFDDDAPSRLEASKAGRPLRRPAEARGANDEERPRGAEQRRPTASQPSAKFAEAYLYVERGPGAGQAMAVQQGLLFIGRASTSGLRIQHASVSRRHAQLTRNGDRFFVRDLASQNGTYVNQVRIDREVEVFPGDELVMGTAQLRLRGPAGSSTTPRKQPVPGSPRKGSRGPSVTTVALVAGLVGFGLAALVMFAWFRLSRGPSFEEMGDAPRTNERMRGNEPRPVEVRGPGMKGNDAKPDDGAKPEPSPQGAPDAKPEAGAGAPQGSAEPTKAATQGTAEAAQPSESSATAEAKPATAEAAKPATVGTPATQPELTASQVAAADVTPKVMVKKMAQQTRASVQREDAPVQGDRAVLSRFENGKLQAAIELARKKNARDLLARLVRFKDLYEAAERFYAQKNEAAAIKGLEVALKAAEGISGGWDRYSIEVRSQLAELHRAAGQRLAAKDAAAARRELTTALQYDPDNSKAKQQLAQLGTPTAVVVPAKADATSKQKIDQAFEK